MLAEAVKREKLTKPQFHLLSEIALGQSVTGHVRVRVARRLERAGYVKDPRCSVGFNTIFTYYKLTDAGRAALKGARNG